MLLQAHEACVCASAAALINVHVGAQLQLDNKLLVALAVKLCIWKNIMHCN